MGRSMVAVCGIAALAIWVGHATAEERNPSSEASAPSAMSTDQARAEAGGRVGHLRIRPGAPAGASACVAGVTEKLAKKTASEPAPSSGGIAAVPDNDDWANAQPISGTGQFLFNNAEATEDGPAHDVCIDALVSPLGTITHDVWFCWTAACTGAVQVDTCANQFVDTKMAVYDGCTCPPTEDAVVPFGCNDDYPDCGWQSKVTFYAEAGHSYMFRIGTYPGDGGDIPPAFGGPVTLTITCLDMPCDHDTSSGTCQPPTPFNGKRSDGPNFIAADDFMPDVSGNITGLCFWGSYWWNITPVDQGSGDSFELRYYSDNGGLPDTLIGGPFTEETGTLFVSDPVDTATTVDLVDPLYEFRVFEYTAEHAGTCSLSGSLCQVSADNCLNVCRYSGEECENDEQCPEPGDECTIGQVCSPTMAVPVTGGECYWIELRNQPGNDNAWFWQSGIAGDNSALIDGKPGDPDADPPVPPAPPDGYDESDRYDPYFYPAEIRWGDFAFCVDVSFESCWPSPCDGASGACCEPHAAPGCENPECCARVCACDPACCDLSYGWDDYCAGTGYLEGCGAAVLCADICCPAGGVTFMDPNGVPMGPDGIVDARQPNRADNDPPTPQGLTEFVVAAPAGVGKGCWSIRETGDGQAPSLSVVESPAGTYTITTDRPITPGEATTLTYTGDGSNTYTGKYAYLPGDVNGDRLVATGDISYLIDCINLVATCAPWQTDVDRSGITNPSDVLREIDLLNGAGDLGTWITKSVPSVCP